MLFGRVWPDDNRHGSDLGELRDLTDAGDAGVAAEGLAAFYRTALTPEQVTINYAAGPDPIE